MAVSKRMRFEILRRDAHSCRYCGHRAPEVELVVDHVVPIALGGTDDAANLVTACVDCNVGKTSASTDDPLVAEIDAKAQELMRAMATAAEMRRQSAVALEEACEPVRERWLRALVEALASTTAPAHPATTSDPAFQEPTLEDLP